MPPIEPRQLRERITFFKPRGPALQRERDREARATRILINTVVSPKATTRASFVSFANLNSTRTREGPCD